MTDTREDVARRLLAVVTLGKRVAEVEKDLRQLAREQFVRVGQREVGAVGDDASLGTVQLDKGSTTWACTDEAALLAYVKAKLPDEVETVERVRPATAEALRKMATRKGAAVDDDGELIAGLTCSTSDPKLVVKAAADAADVLAQAFADGVLSLETLAPFDAIEAAS